MGTTKSEPHPVRDQTKLSGKRQGRNQEPVTASTLLGRGAPMGRYPVSPRASSIRASPSVTTPSSQILEHYARYISRLHPGQIFVER